MNFIKFLRKFASSVFYSSNCAEDELTHSESNFSLLQGGEEKLGMNNGFKTNKWQTTLAQPFKLNGKGVHSGKAASVTVYPSEENSGYIFKRTDCNKEVLLSAHVSNVSKTDLCTILGETGSPSSISTVEHLLAALFGLGIDNAYIEVDGPEMPIMDGSSLEFVNAINQVGIISQAAPRKYIEVLKPVYFQKNDSWAKLDPYNRFIVDVEIDFEHHKVGRDRIICDVTSGEFTSKLCKARTFGFMKDVEQLVAAGFARGATYDNTVVIDGDEVITTGGLRYSNEFVRHKALDAVGDLAMAGNHILGYYSSYKGGHGVNADILRTLFSDVSAWRYTEVDNVGGKIYNSTQIAASASAL